MQTEAEKKSSQKLKQNEVQAIKAELKTQAKIMFSMLGVFWGTYLVNNVWLDNWIGQHIAIKSGTLSGLLGVVATPFLHTSIPHLIGSSIALLFLGWWVMMRDTRDFFVVHLAALVTSGAALWMFDGSEARWFGWGGIAFGMAAYLMTSGIFERRWISILSSLAAIALLGGVMFSALAVPGAIAGYAGVAGGALGGVAAAAYLGKRRKKIEDPVDLVGNYKEEAEVEFDFGEEDDAISHLQAESQRLRVHA